MRLDKWLWAARFYKTRQIAITEIKKGRVRVNDEHPKPSRLLKISDTLAITRGFDTYHVCVICFFPTRYSASIAQTMYFESPENQLIRQNAATLRQLNAAPKPEHKPSKHDRHALRELRHSS